MPKNKLVDIEGKEHIHPNHVDDSFVDMLLFLYKKNKFDNVSFTFDNKDQYREFINKKRISTTLDDEIPSDFIKTEEFTHNQENKTDLVDIVDIRELLQSVMDKYSDSINFAN